MLYSEAYDEMDGGCYRTYFAELLLPNLSPQSVIVVNTASYYSRNVSSKVLEKEQNAKGA
jgi:hypothetical protein